MTKMSLCTQMEGYKPNRLDFRYRIDGLNSLSYSVLSREDRPTYTLLSVELHKTKTMRTRDALGRDRAARLG